MTAFGLCPSMWCNHLRACRAARGTFSHSSFRCCSLSVMPGRMNWSKSSCSRSSLSGSSVPSTGWAGSSVGSSNGPNSMVSSSRAAAGYARYAFRSAASSIAALAMVSQSCGAHAVLKALLWLNGVEVRRRSQPHSHGPPRLDFKRSLAVPHSVTACASRKPLSG